VKVKGIIFDLDGTLIDTADLSMSAYHCALKQVLGREFSDSEIKSNFGPSEEGVIKRIASSQWQECLQKYHEYEARSIDTVQVFPKIEEALRLLKERKILLAIATGRGENSCSALLKYTSLSSYFEVVEANSPENATKFPVIQRVINEWQLPSETVAYIGDTISDIEVAQQVGVIPLWALWSKSIINSGNIDEFSFVTQFHSVSEFIDWIYDYTNSFSNRI